MSEEEEVSRAVLPEARPVVGKIQRISSQTKTLAEDVRTWLDLKMKLAQLEIEERVDAKVNAAALGGIFAAVALIALVFALVTVALGLGRWFGDPIWGFLAVTGLLVLVVVILWAIKPQLFRTPSASRQGSGQDIERGAGEKR